MVRRPSTDPLDEGSDDRLTFTDVTMLAFLAVSAEHRIAAVLSHL